jgi:hypothetical protein
MSRDRSTDGKQCSKCGETTIGEGADGADEVTVEAIFWNNRLVSVKKQDRSRPEGSRVISSVSESLSI